MRRPDARSNVGASEEIVHAHVECVRESDQVFLRGFGGIVFVAYVGRLADTENVSHLPLSVFVLFPQFRQPLGEYFHCIDKYSRLL